MSKKKKWEITDDILLSWTKAIETSAWLMMNSTAFAPENLSRKTGKSNLIIAFYTIYIFSHNSTRLVYKKDAGEKESIPRVSYNGT